VSKRYSKLPTEVLRDGSSLDIKIANFAAQYENYLNKKHSSAQGEAKTDLTQVQMQQMLNTVRAKHNAKKSNK
jgi:hypothetical protein